MNKVSDGQDKQRIHAAAKMFVTELISRNLEDSIRLDRDRTFTEVDSDGWCLKIATYTPSVYIELWLDKFLGQKRRFFWFGFVMDQVNGLKSLVALLPKHLQPIKHYTGSDIGYTSGERSHLKRPPSDVDITHPILETYRSERRSYYGMYDKGEHGSIDPMQLDAVRAANFVREVVDWLSDPDEFSRTEGGRRHLAVEVQIRNAEIARRRKEKDRYRCQVCNLLFEERYGELGKEFAEAHHLRRLSETKRPRNTTLDDLRTVCANCHRMLHKMPGNGIEDLSADSCPSRPS